MESQEVPITVGNSIVVQEYPPGLLSLLGYDPNTIQEEQQQVPLKIRLKSKVFKNRHHAYQQLEFLIGSNREEVNQYEHQFCSFISDNHPSCQEKALKVVTTFYQKGQANKQHINEIIKSLLQKCLISTKCSIKQLGLNLLLLFFQKGFYSLIQNQILNALNHKNPKILCSTIILVVQLLKNFGLNKMNMLKPYMSHMQKLAQSNIALIKIQVINFYKQAYKWMGNGLLPFISFMKKSQKDEIQKFIAGYQKVQMIPLRSTKQQAKNVSKQFVDFDAYQISDAVDPFHTFTQNWCDKVLNIEKWAQKKEELDGMAKAFGVPKLVNKDIHHISTFLRRIVNQSNVNVMVTGVKILGQLANGLRKHFNHQGKIFFPLILPKLRDKKSMVIDQSHRCLKFFFYCLTLQDMLQDIKAGLSDKSPQYKTQIITLLINYLDFKGNKKQKSILNAFKTMMETIKKLTDDPSVQVRQKSFSLIARIKQMFGQSFLGNFFTQLNSAKQQKILQIYSNLQKPKGKIQKQQQIKVKKKQGRLTLKNLLQSYGIKEIQSQDHLQAIAGIPNIREYPCQLLPIIQPLEASLPLFQVLFSIAFPISFYIRYLNKLNQKDGIKFYQRMLQKFKIGDILKGITEVGEWKKGDLLIKGEWKGDIGGKEVLGVVAKVSKDLGVRIAKKYYQKYPSPSTVALFTPYPHISTALPSPQASNTFLSLVQSLPKSLDQLLNHIRQEQHLIPHGLDELLIWIKKNIDREKRGWQLMQVLSKVGKKGREKHLKKVLQICTKGIKNSKILIKIQSINLLQSLLLQFPHPFLSSFFSLFAQLPSSLKHQILILFDKHHQLFEQNAGKEYQNVLKQMIRREDDQQKRKRILRIMGRQQQGMQIQYSQNIVRNNYNINTNYNPINTGGIMNINNMSTKSTTFSSNMTNDTQLKNQIHSKQYRLSSQHLNPWPLHSLSDNHISSLMPFLNSLPFPSSFLQMLTSYNILLINNCIQELMNWERIDQWSDVIVKWVYWKIWNGRKNIVLQGVRVLERVIKKVGRGLSQVQIAIIGGAMRGALGQNDQQILKSISNCCQLFRQTGHMNKILKYWVNQLDQLQSISIRWQILQILRLGFIDLLQSQLVHLARIPQARQKVYIDYLLNHYNANLLSAMGFNPNFQYKEEHLDNVLALGEEEIKKTTKEFNQIIRRNRICKKEMEELCKKDGEKVIITLLAGLKQRFIERKILASNLQAYILWISEYKVSFTDTKHSFKFLSLLIQILIYLDQHKSQKQYKLTRNIPQLIKTTNSLILKYLQGVYIEQKDLYDCLFGMLQQQRKKHTFSKHIGLIIKCIQKVTKTLPPSIGQFSSHVIKFIQKIYPNQHKPEDTILKHLRIMTSEVWKRVGQLPNGKHLQWKQLRDNVLQNCPKFEKQKQNQINNKQMQTKLQSLKQKYNQLLNKQQCKFPEMQKKKVQKMDIQE